MHGYVPEVQEEHCLRNAPLCPVFSEVNKCVSVQEMCCFYNNDVSVSTMKIKKNKPKDLIPC